MSTPTKPGPRVLAAIRALIASGELRDGERIAEVSTAARLGVSRMPVRTALRLLEQEGLVVRLGARGYAARGMTWPQVKGAIEVRGVLEGLAARLVASRADHQRLAEELEQDVAGGDVIFDGRPIDHVGVERFLHYNKRFHERLIVESRNDAIGVSLSRNDHLPFASASAMMFGPREAEQASEHLAQAHAEHRAIVDAIRAGDAALAESLTRAHALISLANVARYERLGTKSV